MKRFTFIKLVVAIPAAFVGIALHSVNRKTACLKLFSHRNGFCNCKRIVYAGSRYGKSVYDQGLMTEKMFNNYMDRVFYNTRPSLTGLNKYMEKLEL